MASRRVEHNRLHRFIRLAEVRHWPARSACRVPSGVAALGRRACGLMGAVAPMAPRGMAM